MTARIIDEGLVAAILRGESVRPRKSYGACKNPACGMQLRRRRRGRGGYAGGCGWCTACYDRWIRAGRPESGPPPAGPRGDKGVGAASAARAAARAEDYADLRDQCTSPAEAGARVGLRNRVTVRRYEVAYQAARRAAA